MSKLKTYGIAFIFTLIFFLITASIFPWHHYPLDERRFEPIPINYETIDFISTTKIYVRVILTLSPWLMMSPWGIISQLRCSETGCLFMVPFAVIASIILLFLYNLFVYKLISFKMSREINSLNKLLKFLLLAWLIFVLMGVIVVYKDYLKPPLMYNTFLKKLQDASKKEPFPESIRFENQRCGLSCKGYLYRYDSYGLELLLHYQNPDNQYDAYNINLLFFHSPKPNVTTRFGCEGQLDKIADNLLKCPSRYHGDARYFGFIDDEYRIHAETGWLYSSNPIPTIFSYYGKNSKVK